MLMKTCKEGNRLGLGQAALFQENEGQRQLKRMFPNSECFQTFLFKNTYLFMDLSN